MNEFYNLRVCTPYSRLLQSSSLKHLLASAPMQARQKALGSRMTYTGLTKQMILSKTKTTRKHFLVVVSVSSRNKRKKIGKQERRVSWKGHETRLPSFLRQSHNDIRAAFDQRETPRDEAV